MTSLPPQVLIACLAASAVTAVTYLTISPFAAKLGLMDYPKGRKMHEGNIPVIGGIGLFFGLVTGLSVTTPMFPAFPWIIAGTTILFIVGLADDIWDLPAISKLIAQLLSALLVVYGGGLEIHGLGNLFYGGSLDLDSFSKPFTVLAILTYVNALNMSDGIDGLAGSLALVATLAMLFAAQLPFLNNEITILAILACILLVFLVFNARHPLRKKANLFLGDNGSLILGFLVATLLIHLVTIRKQGPIISSATALWIVAMPVLDLTIVMFRRILKRRSPFSADREHFHHILLTAGLSVNKTVLLLAGISAVFSTFGLITQYWNINESTSFLIFLTITVLGCLILLKAWRIKRILSRFWK